MDWITAIIKWIEGRPWLAKQVFVPEPMNQQNTPDLPPTSPAAPSPSVQPPVAPKPATSDPVKLQAPSGSMLERFCTAIMNFEGGPGDPNHINNNPGDFRCSPMGYLPKYGNVRCSHNNFAIFPTFELGWEYLLASVHYRAVAHPDWTILDFFNNYAPSSDNNPTLAYAENVAAHCGVTVHTTMKQLFGV